MADEPKSGKGGAADPPSHEEVAARIRDLAQQRSREAYVELLKMWADVPYKLLAEWRMAVVDCMEAMKPPPDSDPE